MAKKKQKKEKKQTTYEVNFFPGAVGLVVFGTGHHTPVPKGRTVNTFPFPPHPKDRSAFKLEGGGTTTELGSVLRLERRS